jgi:hypothetical protein
MNKKETLEEVAEKYVDNFEYSIAHPRRVCKNAFINGAKWQQERSYSEEEVYNLLCQFPNREELDDWFEQNKKK